MPQDKHTGWQYSHPSCSCLSWRRAGRPSAGACWSRTRSCRYHFIITISISRYINHYYYIWPVDVGLVVSRLELGEPQPDNLPRQRLQEIIIIITVIIIFIFRWNRSFHFLNRYLLGSHMFQCMSQAIFQSQWFSFNAEYSPLWAQIISGEIIWKQ